MPFGESFLTTIKNNNLIRLDKTKRFRKTSGSFDWSKSQQFDFPKASPDQLKRIKMRILNERKQVRRKQLVVLTVIMLVLVSVFVYYL